MRLTTELQENFSIEALSRSFKRMKMNSLDRFTGKVSIAMGADGVTWEDFEKNLERNINEISRSVLSGEYTFYPTREREIEKVKGDPSKGTRTLSISRVRDKLVQKQLYETIYNRSEFYLGQSEIDGVSFGYRKGKSTHLAIRGIWGNYHRGYVHVFDADIQKFFDNLDHQYLMSVVDDWFGVDSIERSLIWRYIRTSSIKQEDYFYVADWQTFLKNNHPKTTPRKKGIPQGGVLSGMLANLYLYEFDKWLILNSGLKFDIKYYRYADDFVILTRSRDIANKLYPLIHDKLSEIHLKIHELGDPLTSKTKVVSIQNEGLEFLGFKLSRMYISIKSSNITKFKHNFQKSIKRIARHRYKGNSDKLISELMKYYANTKMIGVRELCGECQLPIRQHSWIGFFAPIVTDVRQLKLLDKWMRKTISKYLYVNYSIRIRKKQMFTVNGMVSLITEYRRERKYRFCTCDPEVIKQNLIE